MIYIYNRTSVDPDFEVTVAMAVEQLRFKEKAISSKHVPLCVKVSLIAISFCPI